ncbi:MAG: putative transposase [Candidatus Azotimanducaceae bacterium]|jgi:putative transposase
MPRQARVSVADVVYHVINRANGRETIFNIDKEYQHFESLLQEAKDLTDMRILAYCIMPNHWHLILYPRTDTHLSEFMSWLTSTHVRQHRTKTNTIGYGHLYQDRYKSDISGGNIDNPYCLCNKRDSCRCSQLHHIYF